MKKQVWFLDVDGVFNIYQKHLERSPVFAAFKVSCWPIPMARQLVLAIDDDRQIHPVWLSCWDRSSILWNELALTRHFPVGYHLSSAQEKYAHTLFPEYVGRRIDGKLIAARYYLRKFPEREVVWIEDGFMPETEQWSKQERRVKLIDTTQEAIREMLLAKDNLEDRAREFVQMCKMGY